MINSPVGSIITKGLGGPACCNLITAHFSLAKVCVEVVVTPVGIGGGGGSVPIPPGHSIHVLQQPVHLQSPTGYVPFKPPVEMQNVHIKVSVHDNVYEKDYIVPAFIPNAYVTIKNLTNRAIPSMKVIVNNITKVKTKISITITKYIKIK